MDGNAKFLIDSAYPKHQRIIQVGGSGGGETQA
jgi:hypothetical protein